MTPSLLAWWLSFGFLGLSVYIGLALRLDHPIPRRNVVLAVVLGPTTLVVLLGSFIVARIAMLTPRGRAWVMRRIAAGRDA